MNYDSSELALIFQRNFLQNRNDLFSKNQIFNKKVEEREKLKGDDKNAFSKNLFGP